MGFVAQDLGIDLGTSNTQVYVRRKGIVVTEPTIVVLDVETRKKKRNERKNAERIVSAVGDDAKIMLGRESQGIMAVRPVREGVITDFDMAIIVLEFFIHKAIGASYIVKPNLFLSYPCSVSSIERRAVAEAGKAAGSRHVHLVEKPLVAAIGSGLPVFEPRGCMIVDIGGGTTDIAVISLGGIVISYSFRVGGGKIDEAITNFVKQEFGILVGERTAEEVKLDLGAALPLRDERHARIRGRDTATNLPQTTEMTSSQIYEAIQEPCMAILDGIKYVLERTPPELAADIMLDGIHITGGGAMLYGIDQMISSELGLAVMLAKNPLECAAQGLGNLIDHYDVLQSMGATNIFKSY